MSSLEEDAEADMDIQMPGLQQHMDEQNRRDSMVEVEVEVEASEISIDTSLEALESSEDTTAETTTSELADSDLSMTDAATSFEGHSDLKTTDPLPNKEEAEATPDSSVVPEQALDTAAQKVFATYALVEQIFLKLPDVKTISMARRTNKTFQNVTRRSFKIRQRLSKAQRSKDRAPGYAAWLRQRRSTEVECRSRVGPSREDWASFRGWELE